MPEGRNMISRKLRDTHLNTTPPTFYTLHQAQSEWNMWPQIAYMEEMMNVFKILVSKCEGRMPLKMRHLQK